MQAQLILNEGPAKLWEDEARFETRRDAWQCIKFLQKLANRSTELGSSGNELWDILLRRSAAQAADSAEDIATQLPCHTLYELLSHEERSEFASNVKLLLKLVRIVNHDDGACGGMVHSSNVGRYWQNAYSQAHSQGNVDVAYLEQMLRFVVVFIDGLRRAADATDRSATDILQML